MRAIRRASLFAVLFVAIFPRLCAAQAAAAAAASLAVLSPTEMEAFLLNAEIIAKKGSTGGVTNARRVTLSDKVTTHDAQIQDVNIEKALFEVSPKYTEVNFKDLYRYNIAAYRLSRLIGLENVPMSVERKVNGATVAMTWWLDDVVMNESERQKKKPVDRHPSRTAAYTHIMRVFDELIQNRDRNGGNVLWSSDGTMWMIDHTRAFRLGKNLLKPELLERSERKMFQKMRELSYPMLAEAMGRNMLKSEIEALLARRDLIVKLFEEKIAARTEAAVLFTLPSFN